MLPKASAIQLVDKAGLVQFFEKPDIDEVLRVGGFRRRDLIADIVENGFDTVERRVRFRQGHPAQQLVGLFKLALIVDDQADFMKGPAVDRP